MRLASRAFFLATMLLAPLSVARAQTATFSDANFANADWTLTNELIASGGTATATQVATGGTTGSYRRADITLTSASPTVSNAVYAFSARNGVVFDPSVSGPVVSIDYSEASQRITIVQACGLAIRQGGVIYYGPSFLTPSVAGTWVVTNQTGLTAASFDALAPGIQNPNFTAGGGPIEFGFYRANSTGTGGPGYSTAGGIDDWSVTVHYSSVTATSRPTWGSVKTRYHAADSRRRESGSGS